MTQSLRARDDKDVQEAVRWALAEGKSLEVVGRGTKQGLGRPSQTDLGLDVSALSGVTLYEPEELVLSARAGTLISEIEALVESRGQRLDFEPMDYGAVLGTVTGGGSLGGVLATNLSGPRRIKAGAARDHFLGVTAVSGRGETFKSGGRVVKNVTGYDLCKVLAGSFGTLAVMTDVTIKTLPKAETETTIMVLGMSDARAVEAMGAALGSCVDVSAAAHVPSALAMSFEGLPRVQATTCFRIEGVAPSVRHRTAALIALMKDRGAIEQADAALSRSLWRNMRDVQPFSGGEKSLWRISTAPAGGAALAASFGDGAQYYYDWGGGLIWLLTPPSDDGGAAAVRRAVSAVGGHATLVRAPVALRAAVDVFEPQTSGVAAVSRRVKEGFDPKGVLNPGRMWAGV